jgi:hypothetical protein
MIDKPNKKSDKGDRFVVREMKTPSKDGGEGHRKKGVTTSGTPPLRKPDPGKSRH